MKYSTQIAKNYANALIELTSNDGTASQEKLLEEIKSVNELLSLEKNAKKIFENPGIPKEEKKILVKKLFDSKVSQITLNLLFLLIDKQRFNLLSSIQDELTKLVNSIKGIVVAEVYSAKELDNPRLDELKQVIKNTITTNKEVKIEAKIEPELIGGVKIKVNNQLYDGSIKGRLDGLKRRLQP